MSDDDDGGEGSHRTARRQRTAHYTEVLSENKDLEEDNVRLLQQVNDLEVELAEARQTISQLSRNQPSQPKDRDEVEENLSRRSRKVKTAPVPDVDDGEGIETIGSAMVMRKVVFAAKTERMHEGLGRKDEQIISLEEEVRDLAARLKASEEKLSLREVECHTIKKEFNADRARLQDTLDEVVKDSHQKLSLERAKSKARIDELEEQVSEAQMIASRAPSGGEDLGDLLDAHSPRRDSFLNDLDGDCNKDGEIEDLREDIRQLEAALDACRNDNSILKEQLGAGKKAQEECARLRQEVAVARSSTASAASPLADVEAQRQQSFRKEAEDECVRLRERLASQAADFANMQATNAQETKRLREELEHHRATTAFGDTNGSKATTTPDPELLQENERLRKELEDTRAAQAAASVTDGGPEGPERQELQQHLQEAYAEIQRLQEHIAAGEHYLGQAQQEADGAPSHAHLQIGYAAAKCEAIRLKAHNSHLLEQLAHAEAMWNEAAGNQAALPSPGVLNSGYQRPRSQADPNFISIPGVGPGGFRGGRLTKDDKPEECSLM